MRLTHIAGVAWLALCVSLLLQATSGALLFAATPAGAGAAFALLVWASCVSVAVTAFLRRRSKARPGAVHTGTSPARGS